MTDDGAATPAKKPGPRLALALIVIALGTALGVLGLVEGIVSTVHNARVVAAGTAPTSQQVHLGTGEWQLYANDDSPVNGPVSVAGSDGTGVLTYGLGATAESRSYHGQDYGAEVRFKIHHAGTYTINTTAAGRFNYIVTRTYGGALSAAAGWFVLLGVGFLMGVVGVVLVIVGFVRRRSARKLPFVAGVGYQYAATGYPAGYGQPGGYGAPAPPSPGQPAQPPQPAPSAPLPPPGWYPDPSIAGMSRWWDGSRWTDNTQAPDQR